MKPNAKRLILDLLLAAGDLPLTARQAVAAGALFGISANSIRVTLARLSSGRFIEPSERGSYRLGPAARKLAGEVATWRKAESRLRPWNGSWIAVSCGALGRSDRPALKRRDRALQMLGLRELDRHLYIRPDNIEKNADAVRTRLYHLGLEPKAAVFVISDLDARREARARSLWNTAKLNAGYRKMRLELEAWMQKAPGLEQAAAVRESFLLGGEAIRQVVFDPLLPEPLADPVLRRAFFAAVTRFDRTGHEIWRSLIQGDARAA